MSSAQGRFGNYGGITCPAFQFTSAAGTITNADSGPQGYGPNTTSQLRGFGLGWKDFIFQLTGTGTGIQVTVYGTIDQATALGTSTANGGIGEWFQLPAPSTESTTAQWSNPLINDGMHNAMYLKAPIIAIRAVASAIPTSTPVGSVELQVFVTS